MQDYAPTLFKKEFADFNCGNFQVTFTDIVTDIDFPNNRSQIFPNTKAFIAMFNVMEDYTLSNLFTRWIPEARQYCPEAAIIVVASKVDLRHDLSAVETLRKNHFHSSREKEHL